MGVSDIVRLYHPRQFTRRLEYKSVVEHLDLYLRALDAVGSMANTVHRHFLYHELRIVAKRDELPMLSEEGVLPYLGLNELNGFLHLMENGTLKRDILDDVHLFAHFFIYTLITDETGAGTREELLWILAK